MNDITTRSSYDTCVTAINEAVKEWMLDQPEIAAETSEDEIWADMAASILVEASPKTAEEVCRVQLGYVPQALRRLWVMRDEAKKVQAKVQSQNRAQRLREEKAAAEAQAAQAERDRIRARTCPVCFTVKTPAGTCNC